MGNPEFNVQLWCYPYPPRNPAEEQILYDHIRTVALLLDALPTLLRLPFLNNIPYYGLISRFVPGLGVDALLGLFIPFIGDALGLILGLYQVLISCLFGLPKELIVWMIIYIVADAGIGAIPLIGSLVDFWFTSNLMNLRLLEKHLQQRKPHIHIASKTAKPVWPTWFQKLNGQ